jgi:WS/DGAT C-terminal domain
VPQYVNGHVCQDMVPLVPLGATMGYAVAILSYFKSLYFGLMADPRVMPDVALMKAFVDDAFADLKRRCAEKSAEQAEPVLERQSAAGR